MRTSYRKVAIEISVVTAASGSAVARLGAPAPHDIHSGFGEDHR